MIFSIIIPHHMEGPNQIKPLLNSINMQVGIDFNDIEIILCKDLPFSPLDNCSFSEYKNICNRIIRIYSPYEQNPGMSRQAGVDIASGEYIIFCDADDCIYNLCALREIIDNINLSHADIYRYKMLEEKVENDVAKYVVHDYDIVFVTSKAWKAEFLRKNNIRFSPELKIHEDNYYNLLALYCGPKIINVDSNPIYLLKYNKSSITRSYSNYDFETMDDLFHARELAYMWAFRKGVDCRKDVIYVIVQGFFNLINPENKKTKCFKRVEKRYYEFVKKFMAFLLVKDTQPDWLDEYSMTEYKNLGIKFFPKEPISKYLVDLEKKYGAVQQG